MVLHVLYPNVLYILSPVLLIALVYRLFFYKTPVYRFPLGKAVAQFSKVHHKHHKKVHFFMRVVSLVGLLFLVARPVWVDEHSNVTTHGIDIVLAIDVSESMMLFDDFKDRRSRIEVAKQEAVRFIEKRIDDPIGVVLFGREVISRCPLTLDKHILKQIVGSIELGEISGQGTFLGTGLAMAVNRLRSSKSKSKIVVLLSDGEPSVPETVDPDQAIKLAKQFGVKVYTIGIGNERGGFVEHPLMGIQQVDSRINVDLLQKIATQTGGVFLRANNSKELRAAYNHIDRLEKTEYETNVFHRYYEAFLTFVWIILALLALELFLRLFIWPGV